MWDVLGSLRGLHQFLQHLCKTMHLLEHAGRASQVTRLRVVPKRKLRVCHSKLVFRVKRE